jgi:hypothetical protein
MEIVIDKDFLQSFFTFNSSERHKPVYDDFIRFIRKLQPGFTLISNFDSLEEMITCAEINPLLEIIIEKTPKVDLLEDLGNTLKQPEHYENSCCLKMCLVELSTKECSTLEHAFGYSYITGESMAYKWKPYFSEREDLERIISPDTEIEVDKRFDSWKTLEQFKHPFNAVVIVDKYILSDKADQPIDKNLKPLLLHLLPKKKTDIQIDVTIIAEQDKESLRKEPAKFESIYKDLDQFLKKEFPYNSINLSVVKFNKDLLHKLPKEGFRIHDRRVITNYFCFKTGIGFNLFDKKGKVEDSDSEMDVQFNLYGYNFKRVNRLLKGYAAYANIATEVYGTNKNRLLTLN